MSIEIGAELVDTAKALLAALGLYSALHVGDATTELPGTADFDRIVATCAAPITRPLPAAPPASR